MLGVLQAEEVVLIGQLKYNNIINNLLLTDSVCKCQVLLGTVVLGVLQTEEVDLIRQRNALERLLGLQLARDALTHLKAAEEALNGQGGLLGI